MKKERSRLVRIAILLASLAMSVALLIQNGERWLRSLLLYLSTAVWARQFAKEFPPAWQVASRFIAGETSQDAIQASQQVNQKGMSVTLNYLGESVTTTEDAATAREAIIQLIQQIDQNGVDATVSIKPTQLGLHLGTKIVHNNLQIILHAAERHNARVRVDMEDSAVTDTTLNLYRTLRDDDSFGHRVGIVIQAYLFRTESDIQALLQEGAWVRLCKGAYKEPNDLAFPEKADTDANFMQMVKHMLSDEAKERGMFASFATHDEAIIQAIIQHAHKHQIGKESFEFQMLYGVRRKLQREISNEGYRVRLYIPFGEAWYPYFMRRLAERPANLWFFLSNLFK
ncbi:MAG: proline dehydrogenase [Chloroflexi bacterium]|nr:proline dehydrogenase [Chloroflexota bacterium]